MSRTKCDLVISGTTCLEKLNYFCKLHNYALFMPYKVWNNCIVVTVRIVSSRYNRHSGLYVKEPVLTITQVIGTSSEEQAKEEMAFFALIHLNILTKKPEVQPGEPLIKDLC